MIDLSADGDSAGFDAESEPQAGTGRSKAPPPPVIHTETGLHETLDSVGPVALYLFHPDWADLNDALSCDVCEEFASCGVSQSGVRFFEVEVAHVRDSTDESGLARLSARGVILNDPVVQVFDGGELLLTVERDELPQLKQKITELGLS